MAKAEVHSTSQLEEHKVKSDAIGTDMVRVVSSMQQGIVFTHIDSAPDGRVEIPGLNEHLKGVEAGGILVDRGSSICTLIPRAQWDEVVAKYSGAVCLQPGPGGRLPAVHTVESDADYAAQQSELKEFRTGAEPLTKQEVSNITSGAKGK